jgi:hypothetical protein
MTNEELASFIDWEGGPNDAVMHGLSEKLDDPETQKLWDALVAAHAPFNKASNALMDHIES